MRRMACFVYEAMVLFGIGLIPGLIGALFVSHSVNARPWQTEAALRVCAFVIYGLYFVWFWSVRGQTLPMQTWHIRLETREARPLGPRRALLRYIACWVWIAPPALLATALHWTPWQSLGAIAVWIIVYAASARLNPQRQFWHDALCRTRLVSYRPEKRA
ncbi:MAG: RDD family protein [Pseudomonadota bacterium]|nr:RDD family protein [Pseudomonadota bacterium]